MPGFRGPWNSYRCRTLICQLAPREKKHELVPMSKSVESIVASVVMRCSRGSYLSVNQILFSLPQFRGIPGWIQDFPAGGPWRGA